MPTAPIAALSLVLGFAVADVTGVRPLGGLVLLAGSLWCAWRWRERAGAPVMWALGTLQILLFVFSHVLGDVVGTWGAVAIVAAVAAAASLVAVDRRPAVSA